MYVPICMRMYIDSLNQVNLTYKRADNWLMYLSYVELGWKTPNVNLFTCRNTEYECFCQFPSLANGEDMIRDN